jgi:S1-C subfamily serine protease
MNADEGFEDEGPFSPWVPPDDRLWRHPSESSGAPTQPFTYRPPPPVRSSLSRPWTNMLIAGVVGALLASGIGVAAGGFVRTTVIRPYTIPVSPTTNPSISPPQEATFSWSAVYGQLAPSIVTITGTGDAGLVTTSGMLWKSDASGETAYILAANDDLQGISDVKVAFTGGTINGTVIGTDPQTGLAVISVSERDLPSADWPPLGSLTDIKVGDSLATVDSGTEENGSFAAGQVSSLYQTVDDQDDDLGMVGLIAIDTNGPVADGAAVVESNGKVVGITVDGGASNSDTLQPSYALPMDVASTIATELVNGQRPWHPWIGVLQAQDLPTLLANPMGLAGGAVVESVSPGSPAALAGLRASDVIVGLGNTQINQTGDLLYALDQCLSQTQVTLRYLDGRKEVTTTITVTSQPAIPASP